MSAFELQNVFVHSRGFARRDLLGAVSLRAPAWRIRFGGKKEEAS